MQRFENILVGLELLPAGDAVAAGSLKAAAQARWVAKLSRARIRFVHSTFREGEAEGSGAPGGPPTLGAQGRAALEAELQATRDAGLAAELALTAERVWIELVRAVLRGEGDLVVVGKRAEGASDGRRLGEVATKLLRKCPAPVWVVKPEHDLVQRLVLAATELGPVGDEACRLAAMVARAESCPLHVVHAYQVPAKLQAEAARVSEERYAAELDKLRARAQAHIRATVHGLVEAVEIHLGKGPPATVVREAVAHLDPDLLVMGSLAQVGVPGRLVGATAERLLDRVDCSILALKPLGFESPLRLP